MILIYVITLDNIKSGVFMAQATTFVRLPISLKERVDAIADSERRTKLEALCILVEEAIAMREREA